MAKIKAGEVAFDARPCLFLKTFVASGDEATVGSSGFGFWTSIGLRSPPSGPDQVLLAQEGVTLGAKI